MRLPARCQAREKEKRKKNPGKGEKEKKKRKGKNRKRGGRKEKGKICQEQEQEQCFPARPAAKPAAGSPGPGCGATGHAAGIQRQGVRMQERCFLPPRHRRSSEHQRCTTVTPQAPQPPAVPEPCARSRSHLAQHTGQGWRFPRISSTSCFPAGTGRCLECIPCYSCS